MCVWCVCVLFVHLFQDDLRSMFSPHQVNHGGVQKAPAQVSLYKSHTTEEPLRTLRSGRYCQVLSIHSGQDFAPVELSPTHCPHTDVDVSLKDFPPASSEAVLPLFPLSPSPVFDFSFLFFILHEGGKKNFQKNKEVVKFS